MPSSSDKQARFMAAASHNPAFAKKAGVSQSVASEFNDADAASGRLSHAMRKQKARADALRKRAKAAPADDGTPFDNGK